MTPHRRLIGINSLLFVAVAVANPAAADSIAISTSFNQLQPGVDNQGWVSDTMPNIGLTNDNYITASTPPLGSATRSYFFFDLTGITDPIVSATLELRRYDSEPGSTIEFFDVSTTAADLIATRGGAAAPEIFTDLGSGTSYGSFTIGSGSDMDVLSFALSASVLADLNAASGYFAIGGAIIGTGSMFASSNFEPGSTDLDQNFTQQLVLETHASQVPEPASVVLVGLGAAHLLARAHRNRRKSPRRE